MIRSLLMPAVAALVLLQAAPPARAGDDALPPEAESTVIGLIAYRFAWVTQYPGPDGKLGRFSDSLASPENPAGRDLADPAGRDDVIVAGLEIVVPADRPVIVHGTSADSLHGFEVKSLKLEEMLVPGTTRTFTFRPKKAGKTTVHCSTYCGEEHDAMKGTLRMLSREEFDAWLASQPSPEP